MQDLLEDSARADKEYEGYFGTTLAATVDRFLALDLLIHGWDLAWATGQMRRCRPHRCTGAYADAFGLGENLRTEGVCGPAVTAPDDASALDFLTRRAPLGAHGIAAELTNHGRCSRVNAQQKTCLRRSAGGQTTSTSRDSVRTMGVGSSSTPDLSARALAAPCCL
jgi:hypothetical protein